MNISKIIEKKERKEILTKTEIEYIVESYTNAEISDADMTKLLKSICKNSMNETEIYYLTKAMQNSGETCDLSAINGKTVDKHSTGGVSDSTTLIVAPIIACAGLYMLKASGRSLGHTGGTVDKLEVFKGYNTEITFDQAVALTKKNGACLVSQSSQLAPADKKIYALRDRTGTVESLPLIASSIMSKKLASNTDCIVLDVKVGNGAFMKNVEEAEKLASMMINIAKKDGKKAVAVLTDMSQPLGNNIGNYLEVLEVIDALNGKNSRLLQLAKYLSSIIIKIGNDINFKQAETIVEEIVNSGQALQKLKQMIADSNGDLTLFDKRDYSICEGVKCANSGYIHSFDTQKLGAITNEIENIYGKNSSGIIVHQKIGDYINAGDKIISIVANNKIDKKYAIQLKKCVIISAEKIERKNLIIKIIE